MARLYNGADNLSVHVNYLDTFQLYIVHCTLYIDNVVRGVRIKGDALEQGVVDADTLGGGGQNIGPFAEVVFIADGLHTKIIFGICL